ncbi:MAG: hypothetical protein V4633_22930 [Pseudomonadota bacterium]
MNADKSPLAARREALVAQCAAQRMEAAQDFYALTAPVASSGGNVLALFKGRNLKLPLTIAGVVLGMVLVRPGRALPMITAGLSLWKIAQPLLAALRKPAA